MSRPWRLRRLHAFCIGVTLLAVVALLLPLQQDPRWQAVFNLLHLPGFAGLGWLWAEDLKARGWSARSRLAVVALGGLAVGTATELAQGLIPGRYADLADMARNGLGLVIGLGVHALRPGLLAERVEPSP